MRRRQVAQTVSHVMLDHMSSSGVMHGVGRRCGEERVKHEVKKKNISAVHVRYRNIGCQWVGIVLHGLFLFSLLAASCICRLDL